MHKPNWRQNPNSIFFLLPVKISHFPTTWKDIFCLSDQLKISYKSTTTTEFSLTFSLAFDLEKYLFLTFSTKKNSHRPSLFWGFPSTASSPIEESFFGNKVFWFWMQLVWWVFKSGLPLLPAHFSREYCENWIHKSLAQDERNNITHTWRCMECGLG